MTGGSHLDSLPRSILVVRELSHVQQSQPLRLGYERSAVLLREEVVAVSTLREEEVSSVDTEGGGGGSVDTEGGGGGSVDTEGGGGGECRH